MKKYYIHDGKKEKGPFTIEELKDENINASSPVWFEGLDGWKTVGNIHELQSLLKTSPPPFPTSEPPTVSEIPPYNEYVEDAPKSTSWKRIIISTIVVCVSLFLAILIYNLIVEDTSNGHSNSSSHSYSSDPATYEERVVSVEETERNQPTSFLNVSGNFRPNFIGNKVKINGTITNSASVATYKDVVLKVTYLTKTNTSLDSEEYILYENFYPNSTHDFKLKVDNRKSANSVTIEVVGATAN